MEVQQTLGGRYKLLNELGSGGMAVVWKARDEVLGRLVAVKVLAARYAGDEQSRARIRDEARAAATLSHPNIAQVYDFGESDDDGACLPYVVMELINGPTLAQRVSQGPIPPRSVFRICGEVAAALAAAHAQGLVHRDIKPANVMVTPARTKVVDFGIAAAAGPGRPDDEVLGTPAYLAPERLLSDTIEPASDVYALGVLLYRLLTHESPWTVESTTQMLDAHVYIDPSPMPQLPGVPPAITRLVDQCLRKDPAERPTAAEVSFTLADAAEAAVVPAQGRARGTGRPPVAAGLPGPADDRGAAAAGMRAEATGPAADVRGAAAALAGAAAGVLAGRPPEAAATAAGVRAGGPPEPAGVRAGRSPEPAAAAAGVHAGRLPEPAAAAAGVRAGRPPGAAAAAEPDVPAGPPTAKRRRLVLVGAGVAVAAVAATLLWTLDPIEAESRQDGAAFGPAAPAGPSVAGDTPDGPAPSGAVANPASGVGGEVTAGTGGVVLPGAGAPVASAAVEATTGVPGGTAPGTVAPGETRGGTEPTTEAPATSDPPSGGRTLSSTAGSVVAECTGGEARLTSWTPNDPYRVERVNAGPVLAATAVFRNKSTRIRMTVTCVAGVPTAVVLPL